MARIKKYGVTYNQPLSSYGTFILDTEPNSKYFKITEFKDTFTGGKNGFLIEGSQHLMQNTEIKIQVLDVEGNPLYVEYGNGIPEYYEGTSKIAAVYVYEDTPIGEATITILGELKTYLDDGGVILDIPDEWKGNYNVKWNKTFKINRLISNEDKVRFYKRPKVSITEIVKPLFSTTFANVTKKGFVKGTPIVPIEATSISDFKLPTSYKLTTTDNTAWTGSMIGSEIELTDIGYTATISDVLNKNEILVTQPYSQNGLVSSFSNQRYTSSFNYIEGVSNIATALTGSFAKIQLTDLTTFVGDCARVKIFRKSQSQIGDYQFVQEVKLETNELLIDLESQTTNQDYYGLFTQDVIKNYWVTSSNSLTATFNQNYLYDSVKLDSSTSRYFFTSKSLDVTEGKEYTLNFNVRLGNNTSSNNYIRAFLSGSKQSTIGGITQTIQVEQDITNIVSSNSLLQKTTSIDNIQAEQIENVRLYFEVVGSGWYISNISFTSAQETSFSPDEISFIQTVPRSLPVETFDYRFEFYDINNNYIPVLVEQNKTFNGGNIQNLQKSLVFSPRSLTFQFDSGSSPIPPTVVGFAVTKNLLTGSVTYTSQSYDFDGNELFAADYVGYITNGGGYPGLLNDLKTDSPSMTVQHFTGSRENKLVQIVKIKGECEGYEDTVIFTKVLDGFGGVNHLIRPYRGTQIRNSSTQSLEIQAIRVDGVNDIELSSTTQPGKGWPSIQLHILHTASANYSIPEKFINLYEASSSKYIKGLTSGSLGSTEINYNASFNRDSIDTRRTIYLMSSASAASGPAFLTSGSVLASIILEDLQDGLDTGVIEYNTDVYNINFRNGNVFTPSFTFATASFTIRGTNGELVTSSFQVYPSMSLNNDFTPEYWMYYTTQSCHTASIAVTAIDENKNVVNAGAKNGLGLANKQSKKLTITFTYTEPYTLSQTSIDKTFTIVPDGKPGDESIVFEMNPLSVNLKANSKGEVASYQSSITDIRLKQGSRYLSFTGSISQSGTFYIAQESIISSSITGGLIYFDKNYTSSMIVSASSGLCALSGSIIYPLVIHPYYTSSIYTQSIAQLYTKTLDGPPPIEVIISPASVNLTADEVGYISNYSAANTTIRVKEGSDFLTFVTKSFASGDAGKGTFSILYGGAVTSSNIVVQNVASSSATTATVKFHRFDYPYVSASALYNIQIYPYSLGPGHQYTSSIVERTQTFTKNVSPSNSRNVNLSATSTTVNFDGDGVITSPLDPVVLTATATNTTGAVWYQFFKDDTEYTSIQSDNFVEIGGGDAVSPGETATWAVKIRDGNNSPSALVRAQAAVSIAGIKEGATSYNVVLTNENSSLVYKVSGEFGFDGSGTEIRATKGDVPLIHKTAVAQGGPGFSPKTTDQFGNDIGSIGEYQVTIASFSDTFLTLGSVLGVGDSVPTVADVAKIGNITGWTSPETNSTATIVYQVDIENGRAVFFKTQSISIQYEGNTGPGVVMRGQWNEFTDYIGSVETVNYRRDAVIYPDPSGSSGETHYFASVSGSGPNTGGPEIPPAIGTDDENWIYLGQQDFFVAAKIAIFEESFVKNTINVGNNPGSSFANIVLAGGRQDPYMAIGQTGTSGASGVQTGTGVIGYNKPGIFLGMYQGSTSGGGAGTTGRFSINNADSTKALTWDGNILTIKGSIRQTSAGVPEGRVLGAWVSGYDYEINDIVSANGRSWHATAAHTSGASTEPYVGASYASYWALAADAGSSGTAGSGGTAGTAGTAGGPGPGVVYRGPYDATKVYFKTATRTDAVAYSSGGSNYWLTNNSAINNSSGSVWGAPSSGNANWTSFGAEFSSIATGTIISEQSYVQNTLNVGTNVAGSEANIAIVGGSPNPYISLGQPLQGYNRPGIFLGNSSGDYRMSMSGSGGFFKWNGSSLELSGNITATAGTIGNWTILGGLLKSANSNIQFDGTNESIQVFDTGGALRFNASTELTLPTISAGGATTIYLPAFTLNKSTTDGGGDASGTLQTEFAETTFTTTVGGKHIFKSTLNPASAYTNYVEGYGSGYALLYLSLEVWTGAGGTGTYMGSSGTYYNSAYGSIDYDDGSGTGGYGGYISVTGDTLITLDDGSTIMAKDISRGDSILSWEWRNNFNKFISTFVTGTKTRKVDKIYKVKADGYEVKVSDSHGFWLDNNTEIYVGDLIAGESKIYIQSEGSIKKVLVDSVEIINEEVDVYTIEVAGTNNYISNNILSHNSYASNGYFFNGQTGYIPTRNYTTQANLSASTTYYVTHRMQYLVNSDDTSGSPYNLSSTAQLYYDMASKAVTVELVSSGVVANGGGFQAVSSDARYIRLTTDPLEYEAGGAASNVTYGVAVKGTLNIKDGNIISDTSTAPGWGPGIKAFCRLIYNGGGAGTIGNYTMQSAYNMASVSVDATYRFYQHNFTKDLGSSEYSTLVSLTNTGYISNNITNVPMIIGQASTYTRWRVKLLNNNVDYIEQSTAGGFAGVVVIGK